MIVIALLLSLLIVCREPTGQDPARNESSTKAAEFDFPNFGNVVSEVGDVDGDHVPDIVVGDTDFESGKILARFWIFSGSTGAVLCSFSLPTVDRAPEQEGCSLRAHGGVDVDKDGVPDLLVATAYSPTLRGGVFLVSGKSGSILRTIAARGCPGDTGDWARFVEDFDGDGVPDVGVLDLDPAKSPSSLNIFSGATGKLLASRPVPNACHAETGEWIPVGMAKPGKFPDSIVILGDEVSGCMPGCRRYSGTEASPMWEVPIDPKEGTLAELARWTDFDGDGEPEIAVSIDDEVRILSGKNGDVLFTVASNDKEPNTEMRFGSRLAVVRDTRPGGAPALAIAESDCLAGCVRLRRNDQKKDVWQVHGDLADVAHFGTDMASVGDVNGDGVDDLIVGTWNGIAGLPGLARLISGRDGTVLFEYRRNKNGVQATRPQPIKPAASPAERRDK